MSNYSNWDKDLTINLSGVMPHLGVAADSVPVRSECGIGAMMAWADRLWFVSYVSHTSASGSGTGLYEVTPELRMRKHPESVVGTYANRLLHPQSQQIILGPYIIGADGSVLLVKALQEYRLAATMEHLEEPDDRVYFLTMEGLLLELDLNTLVVQEVADLVSQLELPTGCQPHFKAAHTSNGRLIVANNTYEQPEFEGRRAAGRLAEWDGCQWRIIERTAFNEVTGRRNLGGVVFATGWDRRSAILKVCTDGIWHTYRLPKGSHAFEHYWQTEWPRIREVEHERYIMDCHGLFYELSPVAYEGKVWGIRPISSHLRVVPDFCAFRGLLVMGGNQGSTPQNSNLLVGQPQAGLWLGKTDDLWSFGRPQGWGGPWWRDVVSAGLPSDPYLMTGFENKVLHLYHDAHSTVSFTIEVDVLGVQDWQEYETLAVPPGRYLHHEFPPGFGAHWVRLRTDAECHATAVFFYS